MKANVLVDWQVLKCEEVEKPEPKKDEVLIKVMYAGICGSDVTVFNHRHPTATVPRIMCHEILGEVVEINSKRALSYAVGDRVVVHPLEECMECPACLDGNFHVCRDLKIMGLHRDGGFAQYLTAQTKRVFKISDAIPDKVAVLVEPLAVGFHACNRAGVEPGDSVLIIGGGPIGILCAVSARYFGATRIVVAEINPARVAFIRSLGIDVIDSGNENVVDRVNEMTAGNGFDKVFETSGSRPGALLLGSVTKIRGTAVLVGIPSTPWEYETNKIVLKEIAIIGSRVHTLKNFQRTVKMVEQIYQQGSFDLERMVVAEFPLDRLEEGIRLHQSGTMNGKLLIKIQ